MAADVPYAQMAKPEELVGCIIWLCSDNAGYVNGADIVIDGAYSLV